MVGGEHGAVLLVPLVGAQSLSGVLLWLTTFSFGTSPDPTPTLKQAFLSRRLKRRTV